mgnify:CR=1 FL=1
MGLQKKKYYSWIVVILLWVVALLNYMDRQMLSTMQGAMKADIAELNKAEAFGALMAVFLWIYGLVSPIAGVIADRVSRKWLVTGSLFVWSAVTFLMGYATSFTQLYWLRAFMGISEALYIPSALSLIADWHSGKSRSLAIGTHMTGLYVGQAIGGFGATIAALFSWHTTFHWFGIIGIAYSILLIFLLHENPRRQINTISSDGIKEKTSVWKGLSVVLSTWTFWIILFYFAAPSLPGWATKNWLPTLFAEGQGELIHDGRNKLRLLTYQNVAYVVKQFRKPNFINQWIYGTFRKPKSQRAYENAMRLIQIGVGTPRPVGYINYRKGPLFADSYLITELSACPYTWKDLLLQQFPYAEQVVREVGKLTATLHEHGYALKDYSRGNILFRQEGGEVKLEVVDLNRMYHGPVSVQMGCKNFDRLPATPEMHRWLAEAYAAARGFSPDLCYQLITDYRQKQEGKY